MTGLLGAAVLIAGCLYLWHESGRLIEGGLAVVEDDTAADDWMAVADAVQHVHDGNDWMTAEIERHDFTLWTLEAGWTA